ncbi:MAG: hypothetical protein HZB35_07495 [Nitrospirae bacterium]|jgi:hypothetical protein|nr:hypothetical protein [Nitrospirota bacterium]
MPVNKLPKQKPTSDPQPHVNMKRQMEGVAAQPQTDALGKETERDRELALTDAEWKNLWDATEVVDMDTF